MLTPSSIFIPKTTFYTGHELFFLQPTFYRSRNRIEKYFKYRHILLSTGNFRLVIGGPLYVSLGRGVVGSPHTIGWGGIKYDLLL